MELSPSGKRKGLLTPEQKLEVVKRVESGGVTYEQIAREIGCTRQYIGFLWKKYQTEGEEGLTTLKKRGRPKTAPLSAENAAFLKDALKKKRPSDFGLKIKRDEPDAWTPDLARVMLRKHKAAYQYKWQMVQYFRQWKIPFKEDPVKRDPSDEALIDEDLRRWLKSPIARQIRKREEILHKKLEAERKIGPRPRRGRPPKKQQDADDEKAAPETGLSQPEASGEVEDIEKIDWENYDLSKLEWRPVSKPIEGHGVRTGKHARGSNRQGSRKKRKKRRRRR